MKIAWPRGASTRQISSSSASGRSQVSSPWATISRSTVPVASGQRVSSTSALTFGRADRPGHHALLRGHQRDHPARVGEERAQHRRGEAEADHGHAARCRARGRAARPAARAAPTGRAWSGSRRRAGRGRRDALRDPSRSDRLPPRVSLRRPPWRSRSSSCPAGPTTTPTCCATAPGRRVGVVDAPDAAPIEAALAERGLGPRHDPDHPSPRRPHRGRRAAARGLRRHGGRGGRRPRPAAAARHRGRARRHDVARRQHGRGDRRRRATRSGTSPITSPAPARCSPPTA